MKSEYNKLTVDVIGGGPKPWSAHLEQVCPLGITPFFVVEQTARTGP